MIIPPQSRNTNYLCDSDTGTIDRSVAGREATDSTDFRGSIGCSFREIQAIRGFAFVLLTRAKDDGGSLTELQTNFVVTFWCLAHPYG